jgi:hypothetical protein
MGENDRRLRHLQSLALCFAACVGKIDDAGDMLAADLSRTQSVLVHPGLVHLFDHFYASC